MTDNKRKKARNAVRPGTLICTCCGQAFHAALVGERFNCCSRACYEIDEPWNGSGNLLVMERDGSTTWAGNA